MIARIMVYFFAMTLCGCGPSAKQIARQGFREKVAAMKVCTQGVNYQEFREKRMALETSYTANKSALAEQSKQIEQLVQVMQATATLWEWEINYSGLALYDYGKEWGAMLFISPSVRTKAGITWEQRREDPDFSARNYVRRGLAMISEQCDNLLR